MQRPDALTTCTCAGYSPIYCDAVVTAGRQVIVTPIAPPVRHPRPSRHLEHDTRLPVGYRFGHAVVIMTGA